MRLNKIDQDSRFEIEQKTERDWITWKSDFEKHQVLLTLKNVTRKDILPNSPFSHPHVHCSCMYSNLSSTKNHGLVPSSMLVLDTTLSLAWGISDLHIVHTHIWIIAWKPEGFFWASNISRYLSAIITWFIFPSEVFPILTMKLQIGRGKSEL